MADDKKLTVTFTMHLKEPLTDKERDNIVGNLYQHIAEERHGEFLGFDKIDFVESPDGKHRTTVLDMLDVVEVTMMEEGIKVADDKPERPQ